MLFRCESKMAIAAVKWPGTCDVTERFERHFATLKGREIKNCSYVRCAGDFIKHVFTTTRKK